MRKKFRKKELENTSHVFVHIIPRHIEKKTTLPILIPTN